LCLWGFNFFIVKGGKDLAEIFYLLNEVKHLQGGEIQADVSQEGPRGPDNTDVISIWIHAPHFFMK
jgi:hypothetical protein